MNAALDVRHIKGAGGQVLAEDHSTATAPGMPNAAIATGCVDLVLPPPAPAQALVSMVMAPDVTGMNGNGLAAVDAIPPATGRNQVDVEIADEDGPRR